MEEVAEEEIQTEVMDHHGLVAAVCQDLKIAERIDNRLRSVSPGIAAVAMIINGGFCKILRYFGGLPTQPLESRTNRSIRTISRIEMSCSCFSVNGPSCSSSAGKSDS